MATIPPFVRLDPNQIPEDGPSLLPYPAPFIFDSDGPAIGWTTTGGFTGAPSISGNIVYRFGSLVHYGFSAAGLTAAPASTPPSCRSRSAETSGPLPASRTRTVPPRRSQTRASSSSGTSRPWPAASSCRSP